MRAGRTGCTAIVVILAVISVFAVHATGDRSSRSGGAAATESAPAGHPDDVDAARTAALDYVDAVNRRNEPEARRSTCTRRSAGAMFATDGPYVVVFVKLSAMGLATADVAPLGGGPYDTMQVEFRDGAWCVSG